MRRRGFSLLEVLVAGALLSLALAVVLAPLQGARDSSGHAQSRLDAVRLAQQLVQEVRVRPAVGSRRGESARMLYDVRVTPAETGLTRVDVEVRWGDDRSLSHQTLLYGLDR